MAHISHDWNFICHSNSNHLSLKTWKNETLLSVRLPRYEQQCPPTSFHSWILKIKMKIHCWQGCISSKSFRPCTNLLKIPPKNEDTFHWTLHKTLWLLGHRCAFYPPLCESHTSRVRNNLSTHQLYIVFITQTALMARAGPVQTVGWKLLGLNRVMVFSTKIGLITPCATIVTPSRETLVIDFRVAQLGALWDSTNRAHQRSEFITIETF